MSSKSRKEFEDILGGSAPTPSRKPDREISDTRQYRLIPLSEIDPDPDQPRRKLDNRLRDSIVQYGVLEPLIVSPQENGRFLIIAGGRRFEGAKAAGIDEVEAIVRTVEAHKRLELQLIENLHREELSEFDEGEGYRRLKEEFNATDEELAKNFGKSRSYVNKTINLSRIPTHVREACQQQAQESGKAITRIVWDQMSPKEGEGEMMDIFSSWLTGAPQAERIEKARVKSRRKATPGTKPKRTFPVFEDTVVIIQSMKTTPLSSEQVVRSLKKALENAVATQLTTD